MSFTAGEMGERLARAFWPGWAGEPRGPSSLEGLSLLFARRVRAWAQAGLFPTAKVSGRGRTSAVLYEDADLALAGIYNVLSGQNIPVPGLREVRDALIGAATAWRAENADIKSQFAGLVEKAKSGDFGCLLLLYFDADGYVRRAAFVDSVTIRPEDFLCDGFSTEAGMIVLSGERMFRALALPPAAPEVTAELDKDKGAVQLQDF